VCWVLLKQYSLPSGSGILLGPDPDIYTCLFKAVCLLGYLGDPQDTTLSCCRFFRRFTFRSLPSTMKLNIVYGYLEGFRYVGLVSLLVWCDLH
jgi:hypothetical protein